MENLAKNVTLQSNDVDRALLVDQQNSMWLKWQQILTPDQLATLITNQKLTINFAQDQQQQYQLLKTFNDEHYQQFVDTNLWQLYLATGFVEFDHPATNLKVFSPWIVCPLTINFHNNDALLTIEAPLYNDRLVSKFNQLKQEQHLIFDLPILKEGDDLITFFKNNEQKWDYQASLDATFEKPITADINKTIKFNYHPGIAILNFNPQGDYLVRQLARFYQNDPDLATNLLATDSIDHNQLEAQIFKQMVETRGQYLYKISPTNYSQDRAILAALNFHSFIEGPPGTGKTQCLTNLLVNILIEQKRAIVSSQKQIALTILLNKLGPLQSFVLNLNKTTLIKSNFYHQIRQTLKLAKQYSNQIVAVEKVYNCDEKEWNLIDQNFAKLRGQSPLINEHHHWFKDHIQFAADFKSWLEVNGFEQEVSTQPSQTQSKPKKWFKIFSSKTQNQVHSKQNQHDHDHPQYQKWIEFQAAFSDQNAYENAFKQYQHWQATIAQAGNDPTKHQINALDQVFYQVQHQIGKRLITTFDQSEQSKAYYYAFTKDLEAEVLSPLKFVAKYQQIMEMLFPVVMTIATIDLSLYQINHFDYSIIDEASQMTKDAGIVLLALGKIRILAGDNAQLPPINYFKKQQVDQSWGKIESILQFAKTTSIYHILLNKTYRANRAQLMTFNAHHFYDDRLDISDVFVYENDNSLIVKTIDPLQTKQNLEQLKANPQSQEAKIYHQIIQSFPKANFWELRTISSYLFKLFFDQIEDYYQLKPLDQIPSTIIVLANQNQQAALEKYLRFKFANRLDELINQNHLIIKNLTNIQGIESDLVILGLTYHPQSKFAMTIFGQRGGQNALNVATSRAKSKMIVVKSISAHDLNLVEANHDLQVFAKYLHFLDQSLVQRQLYRYQNHTVSPLSLIDLDTSYRLKAAIKEILKPHLNVLIDDQIQASSLKIFENYYIATIGVDLALVDQDRNLVVLAFIINQSNDLKTYWELKDRFLYLKHRQFNVFIINDDSDWIKIKQQVQQAMSHYQANKLAIKTKAMVNEIKTNLPLRLEEITGGLSDQLLSALEDDLKKK